MNELQIEELNRRISKSDTQRPYVEQIRDVYASKMAGWYDFIHQSFLSHAGVELNAMTDYMKEHIHSSAMRGIKWKELYEESKTEPELVVTMGETLFAWFEQLAKFGRGRYLPFAYNLGSRARGNGLGETTTKMIDGKLDVRCVVDRCRIIQFGEYTSLFNMLLLRKKQFYEDVINHCKDTLGITSQIETPIVSGGGIYGTARDWLKSYNHMALDAANHDANVISILGDDFTPYGSYLDRSIQLPSGIWATSIFGIMASLVYLAEMERSVGDMSVVLLGDDMNVFVDDSQQKKLASHKLLEQKLVKWDTEDTKYSFVLGIALDKGTIMGLKPTLDNAEKMIGLSNLHAGDTVKKRMLDLEGAYRWRQMYEGRINGRDLVTVMSEVKAEDFKGPGQILEKLAEGDQ
jgi:hypothetical protein